MPEPDPLPDEIRQFAEALAAIDNEDVIGSPASISASYRQE